MLFRFIDTIIMVIVTSVNHITITITVTPLCYNLAQTIKPLMNKSSYR